MRSLACLVFLVPALAAAQAPADAGTAVAPPAVAAPQPVDLAQRMDTLWDTRGPAAIDQQNEALAKEALAAQPQNFEILWRVARWKVWVSDGLENEKQKAAVAKEAWEVADRARALKPDHALGHYYAAGGVGIYAQGIGILNAIGQGIEGKFNERLDKALSLDPTVDSGGPWMAKGRYFYELPWFMRDLKKSRDLLEKVASKFPQNLRGQLYLAETLELDGKKVEAKAVLDRVFNHPGNDPAEARRVRGRAKRLQAELLK